MIGHTNTMSFVLLLALLLTFAIAHANGAAPQVSGSFGRLRHYAEVITLMNSNRLSGY